MIQPKVKINKKKKEAQREKMVMGFIYLILAFVIIVLLFTTRSILFPEETNNQLKMPATTNRMPLTLYDKELARKMMDKNNDDLCDACGMNIEACIESGMIECSMSQDAEIGILHSQHIHADMKIFINDKMFDEEFFKPLAEAHEESMKNPEIKITSSFIHVHEPEKTGEKIGDVLHMHATGVPLWLFFKSIEFEVSNSVRLYVDGKLNSDSLNYVFKDGDKLLLTDSTGEATIKQQVALITNFAKEH